MKLDEIYRLIVNENEVVLTKFVGELCARSNITIEALQGYTHQKLKGSISLFLNRIRSDAYKLIELQEEIKQADIALECFRRAYVGGDSYDGVAAGKNTGGSQTPPDIRPITLLELKEKQKQRIAELERAKEFTKKTSKSIEDMFDILHVSAYPLIMKYTYIHGKSNLEIAHIMDLSVEYVDNSRFRAMSAIVAMVIKHLKGQEV